MSNRDPFGLDSIFGPPKKKSKKRDKRRSFTKTQKNEIWAQQNGKCAKCRKKLDPRTVEYDHGKAWADGGQTTIKNGRALCANCHKLKTHKDRLKKTDKKRKSKKKKQDDPLGLGGFSIDFGI